MSRRLPLLGVTIGDPAGIGPEVAVRAAAECADEADVVLFGDVEPVRKAASLYDLDLVVDPISSVGDADFAPETIEVLDCSMLADVEYGAVRAAHGTASMLYVERAVGACVNGEVDAVVTGPVNGQAVERSDGPHSSLDGVIEAYTGATGLSTMLISESLRVAHVSMHVPLLDAVDMATTSAVLDTVERAGEGLRRLGFDPPTVAVAGLNPHAGDGGRLGAQDDEQIRPAVERARDRGLDVTGPVSPDVVFHKAASGSYDAVVAMYHDQGHIPFKQECSRDGYVVGGSMTLGAPIIRTGVAHGTAYDIVGRGIASPLAMRYSIRTAASAVERSSGN